MKTKTTLYATATFLLMIFALPVCAATYTWIGTGFMGSPDYLWSNPFNWQGASAPQTGETNVIIIFPNSGAPRNTTNDIGGLVVESIRFQGDNYTVAGKAPGNVLALTSDRFSGDSIEATGNNCKFHSNIQLILTNDITADVAAIKTFT
ncbi:MAG: hypothetical protein JWM68_3428, partial [Verrucomicrobiales bacterium]|nr:hypothetical protein [Verrucomicrobiales bacterium]